VIIIILIIPANELETSLFRERKRERKKERKKDNKRKKERK
jgi:hypothetical protein